MKESRCLGVFGLNLDTGSRELREAFSQYGPIDDIQVVYDYNTGRSRGFAFIYMKHLDDAIEVIQLIAVQLLTSYSALIALARGFAEYCVVCVCVLGEGEGSRE